MGGSLNRLAYRPVFRLGVKHKDHGKCLNWPVNGPIMGMQKATIIGDVVRYQDRGLSTPV
jgi:hypothetical protein